jgi:hypothetical protein
VRFCRLLGAFAVLVIMESAGALSAQPAGAAGQVSTSSGTTIGPVPISVLGHPACPRPRAASDAITPRAASRWSIGYSARSHPDRTLCAPGYVLW